MTDSGDERLLEHEYDGIREYDNPTPGWWHVIFVISIVFSAFYIVFWHFSPAAWTIQEAHQRAVEAGYERRFGDIGTLEGTAETIVRMMNDPEMMALAKSKFETTCSSCHGTSGGGSTTAPTLTDNVYIHVTKIEDIYDVITNGRTGNIGVMQAWPSIDQNMRVLLAAYVASLRGSNARGGRGPDGAAIESWPAFDSGGAAAPAPQGQAGAGG